MEKITKSYVIKVRFPAPVEGKREHFFGSLAAIYEKFTPYQIGCKLPTLWKAGIEPGNPKNNKKRKEVNIWAWLVYKTSTDAILANLHRTNTEGAVSTG